MVANSTPTSAAESPASIVEFNEAAIHGNDWKLLDNAGQPLYFYKLTPAHADLFSDLHNDMHWQPLDTTLPIGTPPLIAKKKLSPYDNESTSGGTIPLSPLGELVKALFQDCKSEAK